jgi:hypothetical protein
MACSTETVIWYLRKERACDKKEQRRALGTQQWQVGKREHTVKGSEHGTRSRRCEESIYTA